MWSSGMSSKPQRRARLSGWIPSRSPQSTLTPSTLFTASKPPPFPALSYQDCKAHSISFPQDSSPLIGKLELHGWISWPTYEIITVSPSLYLLSYPIASNNHLYSQSRPRSTRSTHRTNRLHHPLRKSLISSTRSPRAFFLARNRRCVH